MYLNTLRSKSPYVCNIFSHGVLRAERCFAPNDDEGGAGGAGGKTFTQEEVNAIIGKRVSEATKKFADYEELKGKVGKLSELETELQKLKDESETRGKTAEEKERINAERAAKALERERAEAATKLAAAEKARDEATAKLRNHVVSSALGSGLDAAKVLGTARDKAVRLFAAEAEVVLDDDGKVTGVTYGGMAHKTPAEAAAAFLKDNEFLAAARGAPSGAGTTRPNSGGNAPDVFKASAEENFAMGLSQPPKPFTGSVPGVSGT